MHLVETYIINVNSQPSQIKDQNCDWQQALALKSKLKRLWLAAIPLKLKLKNLQLSVMDGSLKCDCLSNNEPYKLKFNILSQLTATLNNYAFSLPPLANINSSASPEWFLLTM